MIYIIFLLVFATFVTVLIIADSSIFKARKEVLQRMELIKQSEAIIEDAAEFEKSLLERLIQPVYLSTIKAIGQVAPKEIKQQYENLIMHAGGPTNVTPASIIAMQILLAIFLGILVFLFSNGGINNKMLFIVIVMAIGFILPSRMIKIQADKRKATITKNLPDFLDMLYISVEAGLSFDLALMRTAEKLKGPLSEEINKTLEEISRGRNREDGLKKLIQRTGVDDISTLVRAIIQTEQLGSDIGTTLSILSNTMRQKRRQRAEEAARKLPVLMMLPLVFFIFPSLIVVVLGPAVLRIMSTLSGL